MFLTLVNELKKSLYRESGADDDDGGNGDKPEPSPLPPPISA